MAPSFREQRGICGICSAGCWIVAEYNKQGKMIQVRPDGSSPMGILCKMGERSVDIVYSGNRLLYPQRRRGGKGSFDFERISWDDAYEIIAAKLEAIKKEHGPEAAAIYTGVGTFELSYCDIFQPAGVAISSASSVLFPFGSPNTMGVGALCYVAYGMIAPHVTMGRMLFQTFNDIDNAQLIIVWGTNPATDSPPVEMNRVMAARRRGARVVIIDPRRTETARESGGQWIPIRPGTDGAFALGMCNVIIKEELYDDTFVRNWTTGFYEFARYAQHYTPENVEHITGVPAGTVSSLAREIATARGASKLMYTGMEYSGNGVQNIRAALTLWALAGQLDVPGGLCFTMDANAFPINRDALVENPVAHPRLGRDRFPLYIHYRDEAHAIALPESVLKGIPYKIRALIVQGSSIITSWPDPGLWKKTLKALDFMVCVDRQLTADAAYADIVLPASTHYEITSYMTYGSMFRVRERMVEPRGESRGDTMIMAELARRLGYGHLYPQSEEEALRHVLKNSGFTLEEVRAAGGAVSVPTEMMQYKKWEKGLLRKDGAPGFETPSGKFEIASSVLEDFGYDPLPVYNEPGEGPLSRPDLFKRFPLVFNSGARTRAYFHTQHHGIAVLNRESPEPAVTINRSDAEARGIADGDLVRITTPRGAVTMQAVVSDDIATGFIEANHACGGPVGPDAWRDTNVNELTDLNRYDPISGFPAYKALLCEVSLESKVGVRIVTGKSAGGESSFAEESQEEIPVIYLDHNATTPLAPEVREKMLAVLDAWGNPSSIYEEGRQGREIIENARRAVAQALGCTARRIVFTGGGSESINLAIKGIAFRHRRRGNHIITSSVEHPAVMNACRWLRDQGYEISFLNVDSEGVVDPTDLEKALGPGALLVSVMLANNETGSLQPVTELARLARDRGAYFHCDATQAIGKISLDAESLGVDLLTISAHKIHGPKGVGALYVRRGVEIDSLTHGGSQEWGLRAGTENTAGIAGFGRAAELALARLPEMARVRALRDRLELGLKSVIPDARLNGHRERRLPNTLNMVLPGFRGESMVLSMDRRGVRFSSGSACRSGSPDPSHALLAMGLSAEEAHCSVRFSLGRDTTTADIDRAIEALGETVRESREIVHFVPCR